MPHTREEKNYLPYPPPSTNFMVILHFNSDFHQFSSSCAIKLHPGSFHVIFFGGFIRGRFLEIKKKFH